MIVFQAPPDTGTRWMYAGIGSQRDSHHKPRNLEMGREKGHVKCWDMTLPHWGLWGKVGHLAPHQTRRPLSE